MIKVWKRFALLMGLLAVFAAPLSAAQAPQAPLAERNNAFDRWLAKKDPAFAWTLNNTIQGEGYTGYVLKMTSQTWRSSAEVDHPVWNHWVIVTVPTELSTKKTAFLYIDGGSITEAAPTRVAARNIQIATNTHTVAVEVRGVPNAKHDMAGSDVIESVIARYQMILDGKKTPRYAFTKQADGSLLVSPRDKPTYVKLWQATNPRARDFRVDTIGQAYLSSSMRPERDGTYIARVGPPAEGFTAWFVELTYDVGAPFPLKVTSEVTISPDTKPYKWEKAAAQYPKKTPR